MNIAYTDRVRRCTYNDISMICTLITIVFNIFTSRGGKRIRNISGVRVVMEKIDKSRRSGGEMRWKRGMGGGGVGLVRNRVSRRVTSRSQRFRVSHSFFAQANSRSPARLRSQGSADGAWQKGENRG